MSTPAMFNVIISAGSKSSSFDVDIIDDMIQEDNETFNITIRLLPSCILLSLDTSSSTVTIIDDDVSVISVGFIQDQFSGSEAMGFVMVNLELAGGTSAMFSLQAKMGENIEILWSKRDQKKSGSFAVNVHVCIISYI